MIAPIIKSNSSDSDDLDSVTDKIHGTHLLDDDEIVDIECEEIINEPSYALAIESFPVPIPKTFQEAISGADVEKWKEAIVKELMSLKSRKVWTIVDHPANTKIITHRWLFTVKIKVDGTLMYKAPLVARGFQSPLSYDSNDIYAPVAKMVTVHWFFIIANKYGLRINQLDVRTAFLYGHLDSNHPVYMTIPEGVGGPSVNRSTQTCRLNRSLYGLPNAPKCWNYEIDFFLKEIGFI